MNKEKISMVKNRNICFTHICSLDNGAQITFETYN